MRVLEEGGYPLKKAGFDWSRRVSVGRSRVSGGGLVERLGFGARLAGVRFLCKTSLHFLRFSAFPPLQRISSPSLFFSFLCVERL